MKALIVDDERLARVNLKRLLESYPDIEIAGEADSCASAVEAINLHQPELIFLDIQLGGETGFDLLEMIDHPVSIIFVTAYDEYAIRAFEVNASDYLLKPVSPERLKLSVDRILEEKNVKNEKNEKNEKSVKGEERIRPDVRLILTERIKLADQLKGITGVEKVFPSDANFLLVKFNEPKAVYRYLADNGVIVRDRSNLSLCAGCLRITVGTPEENEKLISVLQNR